ncbi:D-galacturonate reductase [Psilocybe cubensis]|uniref:D-galacturonate reductase n=1 Tax=Psilocybe cubensis TaxID=181762 RepID=A0ACB8GSF8_PSICU|nr:D-galacturonate reductase [Psilocybe cubensis]KAH9478596.1 D-galacturonate reductase [Psilocybe cubensis]
MALLARQVVASEKWRRELTKEAGRALRRTGHGVGSLHKQPQGPKWLPYLIDPLESIAMSIEVPKIKLNNGVEIPAVGLGTWQSKAGEVEKAVEYALKEVGYRHLDCAWAYGNEKEVGDGIRASGVPRSEVFITSKLWGTWHNRVEECLDQTLTNLGTDYIDLPLNPKGNHPVFPTLPSGKRDVYHEWDLKDTWKQMEELVKKGKVKSIGVSNFSEAKLELILPTATIIPAVNQLEIHVYNPQHKLLKYLKDKGIAVEAYSPLGSTNSPLFTDDVVVSIASKHSIQPSDVLLGYLLAKDIIILPKSVTPARIAANFGPAVTAAKKLDTADIEQLDGLAAAGKQKRFITPPWPVDLGFDNWPPLPA